MSKKNSRFREDAKYWLEPSAAALAKLEEIQSSVTSMKPASSYNVQSVWVPSSSTPPTSSRGKVVKASPYTELETKPPLSSLSIQKTAWGSNTSIPDLIKQQGERQKLRDARGPRRPWSGRKVPPSPTAQRRASQGGLASESAAELTGAFIAVKGSKSVMYDPGTNSRPQSGRSQSASSSTVPHSESCDVFAMMEAANTYRPTSQESGEEQDNALEEFLRSQPDGQRHELSKLSAAYADERNITPPPPPPCASPDLEKLINGGFEAEGSDNDDGGDGDDVPDDDGAEEIVDRFEARTPKQPAAPQLLRRPTPEPIKLSMTLPGADVEEDYSTDEDGSSDAPSPQLSPDIEVQSISSESFAQLAPYQSQFQSGTPASNGPSHNGITSVSVTPRSGATTTVKNRVDDSEDSAGADKTANRNRSKGKLSVQFVEEKNVTFDITPRGSVTTLRPRPPSAGRERHRPQSALKSSKFNKANTTDSRTAHSLSLTRSSRPLSAGRGRHFSSSEGDGDDDEDDDEEFVSSDSQVGADKMMDTLNDNSLNETSDRQGQMKPGRRQDIETMMSRLALPQKEENEPKADTKEAEERAPRGTPLDITRTIQVSSSASSRKNFYEKAINAKKKSMYQQRQAAAARTLTTKVIEYGENGPTMETKGVSYLQVGATPSQSKPVRPGSLKGPKKGWEDGRTQVNRPTMEKKSLVEQLQDRPTSRMGMYEDADSAETNEGPETSGQAQALALQRARPKSAVLRSKQEVTGHRHGKKSPTPSKQRPHSSFVNSSSPAKKPPRRNSSPSGRAHSNSNRALTPTIRKSKAERQRTRVAVRALKDGSLTKNKMFDKQIKSVHSDPGAMRVYQSKRQQDKESDADSDSIDEYPKSVREEEIFNLHRHLLKNGVHISFKTLKRGLVAPGEKNVQECVEQLPSNTSLGLLSQPSAWLGQVYEKYRIAESALRRADHQLAVQEERAVKEAQRLLEASRVTAGGRKKKRKKVTKKKTKSPSSSSATSSRPLSSASVVEREKEKRTSETSVLSAASLLFPPQTDVDVQ